MRDVLRRFRARELTLLLALTELGLARTRFYELYASYLAACAQRRAQRWTPVESSLARKRRKMSRTFQFTTTIERSTIAHLAGRL